MALHELVKIVRRKRRRGRGIGSQGAKSGRGMKGQRSRAGSHHKKGFEGGQTPLYMRLPKLRGMKQKFASQVTKPEAVNIRKLHLFEPKSIVGPSQFVKTGLVKTRNRPIKLIGNTKVDHPLTVRVHAVSEQARKSIESVGGKIEIIAS